MTPVIENVISTAHMGCQLDLRNIASKTVNAEYNPKRFSALILRQRNPKTTALVFYNGKMVCTGAKSEELSKQAARKFARMIQKLGYDVRFNDFKIQNVVACCNVGFLIHLHDLSMFHDCNYEPEMFPGLTYRMENGVVINIFTSGKLVITGARSSKIMYRAYKLILPVVKLFCSIK